MNIYYIGNGFDLAHGLKTNYLDFKEYFKKNNFEFYEKFIELYGLRSNIRMDRNEDIIYDEEDEQYINLWLDFENTLAKISNNFIRDKLYERMEAENLTTSEFEDIYDPDPAWCESIYVQNMNLYDLYNPLQEVFVSWINSIEETQEPKEPEYKPMPAYPVQKEDSYFVVFNYTHTLQKLYGIQDINICYPHGQANSEILPPQFGHWNL